MRKCEKCQGPGPCLMDEGDGRYLCVRCHATPRDPFFLRHGVAPAPDTEAAYQKARDAWQAHAPACFAGGCGTSPEECEPRRLLFTAYMEALAALWAVRA